MRAVQVQGSIAAPSIAFSKDVPKPVLAADQVLLRVHAAGITGDEVTWPELYDNPTRIPGSEVSGTIAALGSDYTGTLSVGDNVYAMLHADRGRGQADYTICTANEISPKPASLSHAEAAVLPIPVLTAWEAIFQHAKAGNGVKVLVTGASGAVGKILVQFASRLLNADVTAVASRRHHDILRDLGAKEMLDYNDPSWAASAREFDCVFDTVGGDVLSQTWDMIKSHGSIVTVGPPQPWVFEGGKPEELKTHPDVKCVYFIVSPNGQTLGKISKLVDGGDLKSTPVREFPVTRAVDAWEFAQQRNRDAKSVITFGPFDS